MAQESTIFVKQLGLAAYIKAKGVPLLKVDDGRTFIFKTEKSFEDWRLEYANSCCSEHDSQVCELRKFMK